MQWRWRSGGRCADAARGEGRGGGAPLRRLRQQRPLLRDDAAADADDRAALGDWHRDARFARCRPRQIRVVRDLR